MTTFTEKAAWLDKHGLFTYLRHYPSDGWRKTNFITGKWYAHNGGMFSTNADSPVEDIYTQVFNQLFEYVIIISARKHG